MGNESTSQEPVIHRPHKEDKPTNYGNDPQIVAGAKGEAPTVYRNQPTNLNWDTFSPAARDMFIQMTSIKDCNRFQICVQSTLAKWAEQMDSGHPNRLPDGNPTYIQNDAIPVIKAYVNRVPKPGLSGSPIPPALPMAELEALDFLHVHQALPYQQDDYAQVFNTLPDGFIWHPIQTLVGVRGLDHRTLLEFRAYKHFWAINKDKDIYEASTKDTTTYEISIMQPNKNQDYPGIAPGGFHNLRIPPTAFELRTGLLKINKERKAKGKPPYSPLMYVRFSSNAATVLTDYRNDYSVFDYEGVPRMTAIQKVPYDEPIEVPEFLGRFIDIGRATVNPLPTISDTKGSQKIPPRVTKLAEKLIGITSQKPGESHDQAPKYLIPELSKYPAPFIGKLGAKIEAAGGKFPIIADSDLQPAFATLSGAVPIQKTTIEFRGTKTGTSAAPRYKFKPPDINATLDISHLSAVQAKIMELQLEKENPRQLHPMSKLPGNGYNFDATKSICGGSEIVGGFMIHQDCITVPQAKIVDTQSTCCHRPTLVPTPRLPFRADPKLPKDVPGYFFACHLNRPKLVDNLFSQEDCPSIPVVGPGAKSYANAKEEMGIHPVRSHIKERSEKEHIKQIDIISIQQTVYYYIIIGQKIRAKELTDSTAVAHISCHVKVTEVLERGQRLMMEHYDDQHFVRPIGAARQYDHSMDSGLKATITGVCNANIALQPDEQYVYWKLIDETKYYWNHPASCSCKASDSK
ncbi:hypothetical protein H072_7556 [Dactylellina haptotyla CBS 200.50]|uniref:Uncharacterized protein n=1 Tax=Dactylellina haptotyla (strain CBS 200.50) TaxID=1284197 RepID=S8BHA6_DACHA|nr:hypothetical protein H072_7556 [Dactylellina haptotyla CBS 200.50]